MARIRTVKPELFRHAELYELEQETGLPVRLCFIALFTCCDKEGRFKWRPKELKLDCLPYDEIDFSRVLDALAARGFLVKYAWRGSLFGCIPTFQRHQIINNKEKNSILPAFTSEDAQLVEIQEDSTRASRVPHACLTPLGKGKGEGKGKEGKGKEGEREESRDAPVTENKFSAADLETAEWIYERLKTINPNHKPPSFPSWASDIRLMRERDSRKDEDIRAIFAWANADQFWQANILSPKKLREKWDTLILQKNRRPVNRPETPEEIDARLTAWANGDDGSQQGITIDSEAVKEGLYELWGRA